MGIWTTQELRQAGMSTAGIRDQIELGGLTRLRRGWYATPDADATAARVVRLGGHLGCLTGCAAHGVWTPRSGIHAVYAYGAKRPAQASGVVFHALDAPQPRSALCSLEDCLQQVADRHDAETALVCLESAVNRGLILPSAARVIIAGAPVSSAKTLALFHPAAESGSETRLRLFLAGKRVKVTPQVTIAGVGRVDLLVGESLIFECDSELYHSGDVDRDRRRDLAATRLGYTVVRLSWQQIWLTWEDTQEFIISLIRTRRHRRPTLDRQLSPWGTSGGQPNSRWR